MITSRAQRRQGDAAHLRFRDLPGSDFIASGFALGQIQAIVADRQPAMVLEVGAGIGALTAAVADVLDGSCTQIAIEDLAFCLDQLADNLGDQLAAISVYLRVAQLPTSMVPFDLVIIDGGASSDLPPGESDRWTSEDEQGEMASVVERLAPEAVVIFENRRDQQRAHFEALAPRGWVHEHVRPLDASPGYHLYRLAPSPAQRVGAAVRNGLRAWWFPGGIRLWRRIYFRWHGRFLPERQAVASGGGEKWSTGG